VAQLAAASEELKHLQSFSILSQLAEQSRPEPGLCRHPLSLTRIWKWCCAIDYKSERFGFVQMCDWPANVAPLQEAVLNSMKDADVIGSPTVASGASGATVALSNSDTPSPSRREAPEALMNLPPKKGRGERRMPVAPAASCALCSGRTHTSNNEYIGITRRSRTQWFYDLFRALPGDRALLPPSPTD
jgi:hypothetical protein